MYMEIFLITKHTLVSRRLRHRRLVHVDHVTFQVLFPRELSAALRAPELRFYAALELQMAVQTRPVLVQPVAPRARERCVIGICKKPRTKRERSVRWILM